MKARHLTVERPDNHATVDFLSDNVCVEMEIVDFKLRIVVKVSNDQGNYTWKQEEFTVDCE